MCNDQPARDKVLSNTGQFRKERWGGLFWRSPQQRSLAVKQRYTQLLATITMLLDLIVSRQQYIYHFIPYHIAKL
jgi:hypothetical protein